MVSEYIHSFRFDDAVASSFAFPVLSVAGYLIVIYAIQWFVKEKRKGKPMPVQTLFEYHNLLMSVGSAVMFLGGLYSLLHRLFSTGPSGENGSASFLFCERSASNHNPHRDLTTGTVQGPFYFWSYIYYLSKYYELLDTVFLAAKGKLQGWGGLNVYHHSLVVFMAWSWCHTAQSLQTIGLLFNTFVHIIMYYYFYLTSQGIRPSWRGKVTQLQIVQFMTSFACLLVNLAMHFGGANFFAVEANKHQKQEGCAGQSALIFNSLFNATLLLEFVNLGRRTAPKNSPTDASSHSKKAVENKRE